MELIHHGNMVKIICLKACQIVLHYSSFYTTTQMLTNQRTKIGKNINLNQLNTVLPGKINLSTCTVKLCCYCTDSSSDFKRILVLVYHCGSKVNMFIMLMNVFWFRAVNSKNLLISYVFQLQIVNGYSIVETIIYVDSLLQHH